MEKISNAATKFLMGMSKTPMLAPLYHAFDYFGGSLNMLYASSLVFFKRPYYPGLLFEQCYLVGVKSMGLVAVTALSVGMVMSLQFGYGLERFGGKLYVPKVVGLSIMRELGPVLTCLMLAGRVGSGIAAEIGSMNVTQQIDAIRALGTDPLKRIVIPRILALIIMCPLLTAIANLLGIFGGMALSSTELYIHPDFYFHESVVALQLRDFLEGISKTVIFGFIIGVTSCYYGMQTKGGTRGVGAATTHAVVTSSTLIMISDIVMTRFFISL